MKVNRAVDIVTIKTLGGYIGLMRDHIPFVSTIVPSKMFYRVGSDRHTLHISGGIVQANQDYVKIITEFIETDVERTMNMNRAKKITRYKMEDK